MTEDDPLSRIVRRQRAQESEGLCPNGCIAYVEVCPTKRRCPDCGWIGYRTSIQDLLAKDDEE